jgi:hypothetical protein
VQVLHDTFEDDPDIEVLAVHADDRSDAVGYFEKHGYTYPMIPKGSNVARAFGVQALPTFLVVGPDGTIVHQHMGRLTDSARRKIERVAEDARAPSG